jgi:aerobic-type carbon monoxide dehydrogenase small subunit (CoxS/CutS family)
VREHEIIYPCPYCAERFDRLETLRSHVISVHSSDSLPVPDENIRLTINGRVYHIAVEPNWTLQHLIHDVLGFTGTKLFCDEGACGACTVIMDGRPVLSCMTLAIDCGGRVIETVEEIAVQGHPLIEAYVNNHAMQCGFCTPGFVVTAKALLDGNEHPTERDVKHALAGNLCRCGTYPQHPKAVLEAAKKLSDRRSREEK